MIIQDPIKKKSINCQSNTKNRYIYIYILRNAYIYSDGFIVTIISKDDS